MIKDDFDIHRWRLMILERDDGKKENHNVFVDFCLEFFLPRATHEDGNVPLLDR